MSATMVPSLDPDFMWARSRSPAERWTTPNSLTSLALWRCRGTGGWVVRVRLRTGVCVSRMPPQKAKEHWHACTSKLFLMMCLPLFPLCESSRAVHDNHPHPPANTNTCNSPPPCLAHLRALAGAGTSQHKDDLVLHGSGDAIGCLAPTHGPGEATPKHLGNHQPQTPSPQSKRMPPMPCNHITAPKSRHLPQSR